MQIPAKLGRVAPVIGFLTALSAEDDEDAVCGGYLLLNAAARPLEFHCTAPVRPNRAQQILYGPTLRPFLYGEQIAKTLLERSRQKPLLVATDTLDMLAVRPLQTTPLVHVSNTDSGFLVGNAQGALPRGFESDRAAVVEAVQQLDEDFDLLEPFQRIGEAIREAQKTHKAA